MAEWLGFTAVVGIWSGVIVLVFRDLLRAGLSQPKLVLSLRPEPSLGEDAEQLIGPGHKAAVWWFHVEASNARRRVPVHDVRVVLCQIEDDRGLVLWDQYIDLVWSLHDGSRRAIGPPALADLCALYEHRITPGGEVQGRVLVLVPADPPPPNSTTPRRVFPYNFPRRVAANQPVVLTLMACGLEGDSGALRVRVAWDGEWPGNHTSRAEHLSVTVVS